VNQGKLVKNQQAQYIRIRTTRAFDVRFSFSVFGSVFEIL